MDQVNQFLDETNPPRSGSLSAQGYRLNPLEFPQMTTLVKKIELSPNVPEMSIVVKPQGIPVSSMQDGLSLTNIGMNLFTPSEGSILGEINPAQLLVQTSGPKIPTNWEEARKSLKMISTTRSGKKNQAFGFNELKIIAKNLNLESTGVREKKEALARRLIDAIKAYHGIKDQF